MRGTSKVAAVLATLVLSGLLVASPAPAAQDYTASDPVDYVIPTKHGKIFMRAVHPLNSDGDIVKAPAILTISPYSAALGYNRDAARWVPRGYVSLYADVIGTGNSGGCYDYGGKREKETGYEIVEWIAKQKWSTGKIGMIGGSYDGTTATATAVMNPPHLTTIVPEAAISRWYEYAYSGGIRYSWTNKFIRDPGQAADEGFDTPLLFDFGFALPPPNDAQGEDWAGRVQSTITPCQELEHMAAGYNFDLPNYDKFWLERDYIKDAGKIDIPVLIGANWGDWNVKQEGSVNLYRALKKTGAPKVSLYMGDIWSGHGTPGGEYDATVDKWMDHYLKGIDNNVENLADYTSQLSNYDGAMDKWYSGAWPKTKDVTLYAQFIPPTDAASYIWQLSPTKPIPPTFAIGDLTADFPATGANLESHASHHCRSNHEWWCFETPAFAKDTRIVGEIKVQIYSDIDRKWVTLTPSIIDVDPAYHQMVGSNHVGTDPKGVVAITRGLLDSRYRNGLAEPQEIKPKQPFQATVVAKPIDYVIKKGNMLWLNVQTEIAEWGMSKPYPGHCDHPDQSAIDASGQVCGDLEVLWEEGKTRLILPVVNAPKNSHALFSGHHH